jgi:hypothetical protein
MEKIKNFFDNMLNRLAAFAAKSVEKAEETAVALRSEERGASDLITVIVLIVIILTIILLFREELGNIVRGIGQKVMGWINDN